MTSNPNLILTILFSASSFAVLLGYIPQIIRIAKSDNGCEDVSFLTYAIWGVSGALACSYSAIVINSYLLFTINAGHTFACSLIAIMLTWKRIKYKEHT